MQLMCSKQEFRSRDMEIIYKELGEGDVTSLTPFHAYSMNGAARRKDLVYANFGREKDFQKLISLGINVTDRIVLTKYGMGGRAGKVLMAERYGAAGILIYGDPKQYAPVLSEKFPHGRWLSDDGVQRGSIMSRVNGVPEGDPMTGGYPAKDWAYRPHDVSEVKGISKIPSQPIAASDAEILLSYLGGDEVLDDNDGWKGTLNVTYRYGPLNNTAFKVDLVVNNENKITGIRNVCGFMKGEVEPDRYVMLGNHIDSWVNGAVDATSGTTVMMEIARVLGVKHKTG
ncbi:N-acetylated-alpha-linked acidic dipeptidase 2-like [Clytia hemisphaerica]|uniref:N-acetylated-alpha-linked acidic dipeptidase 2-like n=1 Tax=Clytia hemisphaerica TaxID=252671 RepID=UPI0034D5C244